MSGTHFAAPEQCATSTERPFSIIFTFLKLYEISPRINDSEDNPQFGLPWTENLPILTFCLSFGNFDSNTGHIFFRVSLGFLPHAPLAYLSYTRRVIPRLKCVCWFFFELYAMFYSAEKELFSKCSKFFYLEFRNSYVTVRENCLTRA